MEDANYFGKLLNRGKELNIYSAFPIRTIHLGTQIIDESIFFLIKVFQVLIEDRWIRLSTLYDHNELVDLGIDH